MTPTDGPVVGGGPHVVYRTAYLPEGEFERARELRLLDATVQPRHEDYRRELEASLRGHGSGDGSTVVVMPLDVGGLLEFAKAAQLEPGSRQTRMAYNMSLSEEGRAVAWPPPRNGPCWCESGRKYKQCCGAPGFSSAALPDPASLVLKVELVGAEPPVWRRIAVPSHCCLDSLHLVVQDVMGWDNRHSFEFENDDIAFTGADVSSGLLPANAGRVVTLGSEAGESFSYIYDLGDGWVHDLTLEEVRPAEIPNEPAYLEGSGACPPEDCGGVAAYRDLLAALAAPKAEDHDDAVAWLGADFDPTKAPQPRRQPAVSQESATT